MKRLLLLFIALCCLLCSCAVTPAVPTGASLTDDWYRDFPQYYCYQYSETIGKTDITYTYAYDGKRSYKRMAYNGYDTTILDDGNKVYSLDNINKTYTVVSDTPKGENVLAGINLCSYGAPQSSGIEGRLYYESFDDGDTVIWFDGKNAVKRSDGGEMQYDITVTDFASSGISMALPEGYTYGSTKSFDTEISLPEGFFD